MARQLPLQDPSEGIEVASAGALRGEVRVFDPALLVIARDLRWLEAQGVTVTRVGLSQEPDAFVREPRVAGLLQAFGERALPAVLVQGAVLAHGRYPTREELVAALQEPGATTAPCAPGSGCC